MPQLLMRMLAMRGYAAPAGDEGTDTGATEPTPELLAEHGLSRAEFDALDERDRENLLADTPDDETPVEGAEAAAATAAVPAVTPPPKKDETPPVDEGADPAEDTAAAAATAAATAAAATAAAAKTAAAPAVAAPVIESPVDDMAGAVIVLPKLPEPPKWTPVMTPELATKRTETETALDALERRFEEGEITREEWVAQRKPLQADLRTLDVKAMADEVNRTNAESAATTRWDTYVDTSMQQAKAAGLDYFAPANKDKLAELDAALKRFAQAAPLMHPGKSVDWRDRWALNQAHVEVAGKHGVDLSAAAAPAAGKPAAAKPAATAAAQAQQGRRAADLSQVPPTLRGAPAAADANVQSGEFAHLEGLTPVDLEKAVARMTPEQQDRYLGA